MKASIVLKSDCQTRFFGNGKWRFAIGFAGLFILLGITFVCTTTDSLFSDFSQTRGGNLPQSTDAQWHRDALPPLLSQLNQQLPVAARAVSKSNTSAQNAHRETFCKRSICNQFHTQNKDFLLHTALRKADGGYTFRRGVLIL